MKQFVVVLVLGLGLGLGHEVLVEPAWAQGSTQTFNAPADRVFAVSEAVLKELGWSIDTADRTLGRIATDSRKVDFDDFGVYATGTRHRLRLFIKDAGGGRTTVTVERTLFKRERILFVDNDEVIPTTDHTVEQSILTEIGRGL